MQGRNLVRLALALLLLAAPLARAQGFAADLSFPAQPSPLAADTPVAMALFKPEGEGPFPALVLVHQCGGLGRENWRNQSMLEWARQAVARGYVALLVDALGPRGVQSVCMGPRNGVTFARGVTDALQAVDHLRSLPYVARDRVAIAGWSWGAMVATLSSSRTGRYYARRGPTFAAAVAFYPGCFTIRPQGSAPYEIVNRDVDRPLFVLLGGRDVETPPADCVTRLEAAKAGGAPVEWHEYPEATHCWDCRNLDGFRKVDIRGTTVEYRYDADATADSARRMFEFLERAMPAKR